MHSIVLVCLFEILLFSWMHVYLNGRHKVFIGSLRSDRILVACDSFRTFFFFSRSNHLMSYIPGGPEITEQSIQSIFQDFALINSYFLRIFG